MSEVRFYTDEHAAAAVGNGLRLCGADILSPLEVGMLGISDSDHLEFAHSQRRVIFTPDADFLGFSADGRIHAGIVYAHKLTKIGKIIRGLTLVHSVLTAEEMFNSVEYL